MLGFEQKDMGSAPGLEEVLSIGLPEVGFLDDEHKHILLKMSEVKSANARSLSKDKLSEEYDELIAVTRQHFSDEEEHMRRMKFPDLEQHQRIHEQLFVTLEKYRQELKGSVYGRFPSSVFDFFRTWLVSHIMIVDQKYVRSRNTVCHKAEILK